MLYESKLYTILFLILNIFTSKSRAASSGLPRLILTTAATQNEHPLPTDAFPGLNIITGVNSDSNSHNDYANSSRERYQSYPVTIPQNTYSGNKVVNPYIMSNAEYTSGTVFIIVGSIIGFVFLLLCVVGLILEFRAWRSAKQQNSMNMFNGVGMGMGISGDSESSLTMYPLHLNWSASELEFGHIGRPLSIAESSLSSMPSQNSSNSSLSFNSRSNIVSSEGDISEKIIRERQQPQYQPIYKAHRNSSSTLNLLASNPELMATARNSLFVSPTEILRSDLGQQSLFMDTLLYNSTESSSDTVQLNQFVPANINRDSDDIQTRGDSKGFKGRHFRSPSAHLDELLARDI